jgi:hypothetical protein
MLSLQHGSSQSVEIVTAARLLLGPYKVLPGSLLPWSLALILGKSLLSGNFQSSILADLSFAGLEIGLCTHTRDVLVR